MYQGELAHLIGSVAKNGNWGTIKFGINLRVKDVLSLQCIKGYGTSSRDGIGANGIDQHHCKDSTGAKCLLSASCYVPPLWVQVSVLDDCGSHSVTWKIE